MAANVSDIQVTIPAATPPICLCPASGSPAVWQAVTIQVRETCLPVSRGFFVGASNPCTSSSGAVETWVASHPLPATGAPAFPAGREVYQWFITGIVSSFGGGVCFSNTLSTNDGQAEFLTGTTTQYLDQSTSQPFTTFELPTPTGSAPPLRISQSGWANHHTLPGNSPVFGLPSLGSLIMIGLR